MTTIRNNPIMLSALLFILFGSAHGATASEVVGSLSSDGSTDTQQELISGETRVESTAATRPVIAQNSGQLQGSVVDGREEGDMMAVANPASWDAGVWTITLAGILMAALIFLIWRGRPV